MAVRRLVACAVAMTVGMGLASAGIATTAVAEQGADRDETQRIIDGFVADGAPGAMVYTRNGPAAWTVRSGTAKLGTERPIRPRDQIRAASNTKMFVATVVLQLVDEGKLRLDAPIEEYLPGLVQGNGYDGNKITLRQLLQHTSGVAEYVQDVLSDPDAQERVWQPEELVRLGLSHPPSFEPGTDWEYSNTGYILLGMAVEAVSGNDIGTEITDRLLRPYGLLQTSYPEPGDKKLRGPHARGYYAFPGKPVEDVTELEPSLPGAAGSLVSTGPDLTRFVEALLDGEVVSPESLAQMRDTVPAWDDDQYGLGIQEYALSCGGTAWGHGGNIPGYDSFTAVTEDGRAAFGVVNGRLSDGSSAPVRTAVDSALCATR
ncbi:D-alanyl-D-alanine carboxypeptidase [Tamaricihabitans halophyticus]|uniref:D-alanyl-D-alanine carboxypeptidase n=1 Tax=Tamaricihabitans halophyticus TaxID=1262583 RepID=A0A4R2QJQ3_9PSEU|nr:serine hydrolase domain-containing protein [Tamaricihabitans halophyticus]TCP47215.1 D-alanyl-D-alanine carboxypeptidase [Tamaricihabitans halophyticus]